jgi:hypothetical protein
MKDVVVMQAASTVERKKYSKKYKCCYCDQRFERPQLHLHIQRKHEDLIPEGWTALRVAFMVVNKKSEGHCIICKSLSDWNEDKGRYERLCNKQQCHDAYKKMAEERNKKRYGTGRPQSDPRYAEDMQKRALAGRRGAGKYKFKDGGEVQYLGTYELKLLEFMDKVMNCKSEDIMAPGPSFKYKWKGKEHLYIPDFYYIPYNLLIEIKDGGDNPNKNPSMQEYKTLQQQAKEDAVRASKKFNYIRQTNNDFGQLMSMMAVLKYNILNDHYDPVIKINEAAGMIENMSGTIGAALPLATPSPMPYESDPDNYYAIVRKDKDHDEYAITKDPLQYTMYGVSNEEPGKYKVYKTDKDKFSKSYMTFKIKDKRKAKELYEGLKLAYDTNIMIFDEAYDNYIYSYLTGGSVILDEHQILLDDRFELTKDFTSQLNEDCKNLYEYLTTPNSNIDILAEQVNELEESIYGI